MNLTKSFESRAGSRAKATDVIKRERITLDSIFASVCPAQFLRPKENGIYDLESLASCLVWFGLKYNSLSGSNLSGIKSVGLDHSLELKWGNIMLGEINVPFDKGTPQISMSLFVS